VRSPKSSELNNLRRGGFLSTHLAQLNNISATFSVIYEWRRGWDSHHRRLLKPKNLAHFRFRTIRWIRTKVRVEARIEHADAAPTGVSPPRSAGRMRRS